MITTIVPVFIAILGGVGFLHGLRWAQYRNANSFAVAAFNYIAAAVIFTSWSIFAHTPVHFDVVIRGVTIGCLYSFAFFLLVYGIGTIGVGKTSVILNLSQAIPILASIVIWGERPGMLLIVGICVSIIAIPLIFLPGQVNSQKQAGTIMSHVRPMVVLAMAVLYIAQGAVFTIMKSFERMGRPDEKPVIFAGVFIAVALLTTAVMLIKRVQVTRKDLFHGFLAGGFNALANVGTVAALAVGAGTIIFPTITAGSIVAAALIGIVLWHERYGLVPWLGLILAVVSVVLINM